MVISTFLSTILSCSDLINLANRVINISTLTPKQKIEIIVEIRKVVPKCPVKIVGEK